MGVKSPLKWVPSAYLILMRVLIYSLKASKFVGKTLEPITRTTR